MKAPGKKVGKLAVDLKRQASRYRRSEVVVELRLDGSGMFHAAYEGRWYSAATQAELSEKIRKAAEKTIDIVWTRYLVIKYEATAWPQNESGRPEESGSYETLSLDDDRGKLARDERAESWSDRLRDRVITTIDLHWEVCEFSQPYPRPDHAMVRMRRDIDMQRVEGEDEKFTYVETVGRPEERADDSLPPGAVLWTAEREALLRDILAALGKLDARMVALFSGDPDQLARQLDAATTNPARLLTTSEGTSDDDA